MEKTVLILKRETSKSLRQDPKTVLSLSGYLLKIGVEIAHNIDRNIFVMQRDVLSSYSQEQLDTFYSIASVGELEWIPVGSPDSNASNFFRTDYIELMFESVKDLEDSWRKISGEVFALAESNDLSINTEPDMYAIYPTDSINIYYGNTVSSPSSSEIINLSNTSMYVEDLDIVDTFNGLTYFTIAVPIYSKDRKFFIDNVLALHNENDITLTNKYGASIPYKIYTTIEPVPSGLHTILFKA
jgi:hypothetical protein